VYTDLQSVASPLGQPTAGWVRDPLRADDEARTRDLNLGKVALYQLSYVRLQPHPDNPVWRRERTIADALDTSNSASGGYFRAMRTWVNGHLLADPDAPAVAARDHAVTVGDGVFEVVKVVDGEPFAVDLHLDRMCRSAQGLGLPDPDLHDVRRGLAAVLKGEGRLTLGRVRITWTGGLAPLGSDRGDGPSSLVIVAAPMEPWPDAAAVCTAPWPRNERGALAGLKTTSYGENVRALAYARRRKCTEAIFANLQGHLCEGTGTNVFYVVDGELHTPRLASGCLAGITRGLILDWYGAIEVDEPLEVVREAATEAFLASTTRDVQGIRRWDDRELGVPGPVTTEVREAWRERYADLLGG
jgi:branched-chain amino acid aminotransferase